MGEQAQGRDDLSHRSSAPSGRVDRLQFTNTQATFNCEQCETAYPFDALADPDGRAAESFDCNTSSIFKTLKMNRKSAPKMCKRLLTSSMVRKEALFAARHGAGTYYLASF